MMDIESDNFQQYWSLVKEYSATMNLTAWETKDLWLERGIKPSLQFAKIIPLGASVVDIGSGQGLPGVVIALLCPESKVTLVEPRLKRAAFLRMVKQRLQLNIEVIPLRAQDYQGSFDIITSRAVAAPDLLYQWTKHLGHQKTQWVLRKPENSCEYSVNNQIRYISYE